MSEASLRHAVGHGTQRQPLGCCRDCNRQAEADRCGGTIMSLMALARRSKKHPPTRSSAKLRLKVRACRSQLNVAIASHNAASARFLPTYPRQCVARRTVMRTIFAYAKEQLAHLGNYSGDGLIEFKVPVMV